MLPDSTSESSVIFRRPTAAVLTYVISGYVPTEDAARDYGVMVRYMGTPYQLLRLPEHYAVDEEKTAGRRMG